MAYVCISTMKTDADDGEDKAKPPLICAPCLCVSTMETGADDGEANPKPPLVCAPCWICLEEGPDEAGEPLVRDCACRGETSAGYHLSCIINYAVVLTKEMERRREKRILLEDELEKVSRRWTLCPNCQKGYGHRTQAALLLEFGKNTEHLPKTHVLRYEASCRIIEENINNFSEENGQKALTELKQLMFILRYNLEELALSLFGKKDVSTLRAVSGYENFRVLFHYGQIESLRGRKKNALVCFKMALDWLAKAEAVDGRVMVKERSDLEDHIEGLKRKSGLAPAKSYVVKLRKRLESSADPHVMCRCETKRQLASSLQRLDPPEYSEAIKLLSEIIADFKRTLGPDHSMTRKMEDYHAATKKNYRKYLEKIKQDL